MKNFFTVIPLQGKFGLKKYNYEAFGNTKLIMEKETSFPIIQVINGYAEKGEEISVVAIRNNGDSTAKNSESFEAELKELSKANGFTYKLNFVDTKKEQDVHTQIEIFKEVIKHTKDEDTLYACSTYGTKPQSKILEMAINYANKVRSNTYVECIVYGLVNREEGKPDESHIYDTTAMYSLNDIIDSMAERRITDPDALLDKITKM